jgi:hypothetical protein
MKRKLFLIVASLGIIAAGRTTPATAQSHPVATPLILCNTGCDNSDQCANSGDACIVCFHPKNHCG